MAIYIGHGELKSVFPNTRAWEQQERNKTKKQTKIVRRGEYGKKQSGHEKNKSRWPITFNKHDIYGIIIKEMEKVE